MQHKCTSLGGSVYVFLAIYDSHSVQALRHRRCSMEVLVSISSTFAYTFSVISTIHSSIVATRCVTPSPEEGSIPYGLKGLNSDEPHAPASTLHLSTAVGTALAPSNFFDTCAFLIPILLLGKVRRCHVTKDGFICGW